MQLFEEVPLKDNLAYSLRRYRVWWVIFLITVLFDFATTQFFLLKNGHGVEANLLISWLIGVLGPVPGVALGKLLQIAGVIFAASLHQRLGNLFLLIVIILNCWAVVLNTF